MKESEFRCSVPLFLAKADVKSLKKTNAIFTDDKVLQRNVFGLIYMEQLVGIIHLRCLEGLLTMWTVFIGQTQKVAKWLFS